MRTVVSGGERMAALIARLDRALGRVLTPLADLMPRRLRRAAERIETRRHRPVGQIAAGLFLLASVVYGLAASGQIGRVADSALVVAGLGVQTVKIAGNRETSESAVIEKLDPRGSLIAFDVAGAQKRIATLPWVERATVRKFYPGTLTVEVAERKPFALWQRDGDVVLIDRYGTEIDKLGESRYGDLPLTVGFGANREAAKLLALVAAAPGIAGQLRAAVYVSERRWDLYLDNNVTVKLPENDPAAAIAELARLDADHQLLARDVTVVDLRLPDRITVRLPEGRTLDEVVGGPSTGDARKTLAKARI